MWPRLRGEWIKENLEELEEMNPRPQIMQEKQHIIRVVEKDIKIQQHL